MSPDAEDWKLLDAYAARNSEEAFRALVERHASMVYHSALRQIGDPALAQDVTQAVFIALAQKAAKLPRRVLICGWLYRATRYAVLNLTRAERSRRRHEQEVAAMQTAETEGTPTEPLWEKVSPHLDEAMGKLSDSDRAAILVRYFGGKSHKEISAVLGISEDAAKKRLSRALSRLRQLLAQRGVAASTVALGAAFAAWAGKAAPAGLAASVSSAALSHASSAALTSSIFASAALGQVVLAKVKVGALVALVALLMALGTHTVMTHRAEVRPAPPQSVAAPPPPQPPPAGIVAWDKQLLPPAVSVSATSPNLERQLDTISARLGAYWSADYVVYDSNDALRQLLEAFRDDTTLSSCGWTNLSVAPRKLGSLEVINARTGEARAENADSWNQAQAPDALAVTAVVSDDPGNTGAVSDDRKEAIRQSLARTLAQGMNQGAIAPERLLTQASIAERIPTLAGLKADRETAARLANETHSAWTVIYTMHRSPVPGVGLEFGRRRGGVSGAGLLSARWGGAASGGMDSVRFGLTPEEKAAHDRAVKNWLQQSGPRPSP